MKHLMSTGRLLTTDLVVPVLLGGLLALGHEPWYGFLMAIPALACMIALWRRVGPWRAAWRGWAMGVACGSLLLIRMAGLHPLQLPKFWMAASWPHGLSAAGGLAATAGAALVTGAIAAATRRWSPLPWALLIVPAAWVLGELLLGLSPLAMPALAVGRIALDMPVVGLVPLLGPHGLSWFLLLLAGLIWLLFGAPAFERLLALLLLAGLPVLVWAMPLPGNWSTPTGRNLQVAVRSVATRDAPHWPSAIQGHWLSTWLGLLGRDDAELIIWPNELPLGNDRAAARILESLDEAASLQNRSLLVRLPHNLSAGLSAPGPYHMLGKGADALSTPGGSSPGSLLRAMGVSMLVTATAEKMPWRHVVSASPISAQMLVHLNHRSDDCRLPLALQRMRALSAGRSLLSIDQAGHCRTADPEGRVQYGFRAGGACRLLGGVALYNGRTPYRTHGNTPLWYASAAIILGALLGTVRLPRTGHRARGRG